MPEGDTILRAAARLREALAGRRVTGGSVPRLVGETVDAVDPHGKHLLVRFAPSGLALHTHLGMSGSWDVYTAGERWRKPRHLARAVIEVEGWTAVCFAAPTCRVVPPSEAERVVARLGTVALDAEPERPIGEALLDQRVMPGVGNIWKSELLFLHRIDPWAPVGAVPAQALQALVASAEQLIAAGRRPRNVYGRARRPCPRCGAPIRAARQGSPGPHSPAALAGRTTYWCPQCQPGCVV